jgi:hypothetical protein
MGILDSLGLGSAAAAPIDAIGNLIGKVYTTEGEKLSAQEMLERLRQNPQLWAAQANQIDAQSTWWFQRGWRPSYGWVGSISLFFYFVPQYIIASYLWTVMCLAQHKILDFPISPTPVLELTMIMLGVYGTHTTIEKLVGKRNG